MPTKTTIPNPHPDIPFDQRCHISIFIAPAEERYFQRGVFSGTKRALTFSIEAMVKKLHEECVRRGIPERWEPENEAAVTAVLADLNFAPNGAITAPKKRAK